MLIKRLFCLKTLRQYYWDQNIFQSWFTTLWVGVFINGALYLLISRQKTQSVDGDRLALTSNNNEADQVLSLGERLQCLRSQMVLMEAIRKTGFTSNFSDTSCEAMELSLYKKEYIWREQISNNRQLVRCWTKTNCIFHWNGVLVAFSYMHPSQV